MTASPEPEACHRQWKPQLAGGVRIGEFSGSCVIAAPEGRAYLQFDAQALVWLRMLDGTTTTAELTARFGDRITTQLFELREAGFLVDSPPAAPSRRVVVTRHGVEFAGVQRLVKALYPVARPLFSRTAGVLLAALAVAGIVLWASGTLPQPLARSEPTASTVFAVLALDFVLLVAHELAHALVLVHYGGAIGRIGIGTYWGALTFYVDASAALLLPRRARILQAAAGIIADCALIGVLAMAATLLSPSYLAGLFAQGVVLALINVLVNATPLLELDGYWILSDVLRIPDLHQRARTALTHPVSTPHRTALAVYAVTGLVFGVLLLTAAALLWLYVFWPLLSALWHAGIGSKILAAWLTIPLLAPLLIDLAGTALRLTRPRHPAA